MKDKDIIDLLGLSDTTIQLELVQDLENIIDKGLDNYLKELEEKENKKQEFIKLFKECYDELCIFMEQDPKKQIAVNCFTCRKGIDLKNQYGKPKER